MPLQATSGAASYDAFGGGVPVEPNYIESVFSCFLYTGTGASQTVTNGVDLSTKGGLVWVKNRSGAFDHLLVDTDRGTSSGLATNTTGAAGGSGSFTSFNTDGFSFAGSANGRNNTGSTYASWSIAKAPKFFDVVTYTGNGTSGRTVAHNLGSVPGCIFVKKTSSSGDSWAVYHRSAAKSGYTAKESYLILNSTQQVEGPYSGYWNNTDPTDTVFTLGNDGWVNANGATYVAYLFAHDAGGFGLTGTDNVISCGSFTTDGSGMASVSLGYEPQFLIYKRTNITGNWQIVDNMRGMSVSATTLLYANKTDADITFGPLVIPTATGFNYEVGDASNTYIYIAIRRGPMKVPTSGTSVFDPEIWSGNTTVDTATRSIAGIGSPTDLFIGSERNPGFNQNYFYDRLRGTDSVGGLLLVSSLTANEATNSPGYGQYSFAQQDGITLGNYTLNYTGRTYVGWQFRRAPSFFDEVCYTGDSTVRTITHNLTVVPEMMIVKKRSSASNSNWVVYHSALGNTKILNLNLTNSTFTNTDYWNDTTPTSTNFTVGAGNPNNLSAITYVAYLFATCAGVSKVGSYTGTGTTLQIDCGFTGGARFVLIKRSDSTGDWYVWDTARGIVSGNDPYLWLNSPYASAEVTNTDYVDTYSAGFEISSTAPAAINASGGTFIFLAIA